MNIIRYRLSLVLLIFSMLGTKNLYAGWVQNFLVKKRILFIRLTDTEKGLFKKGDIVRLIFAQSNIEKKGLVVGISSHKIAVKLKTHQFHIAPMSYVFIEPTYKNLKKERTPSYRYPNGKNKYNEKYLIQFQVGTLFGNDPKGQLISLMNTQAIAKGLVLTHFYNNRFAFDITFALGESTDIKYRLTTQEASLRAKQLFGQDYIHVTYGIGIRKLSVKPPKTVPAEPSPEELAWFSEKKENYTEDITINFGLESLFYFETTTIGNIFVVGFDWLVISAAIANMDRSQKMDPVLKNRFPFQTLTYHSRLTLGFSF